MSTDIELTDFLDQKYASIDDGPAIPVIWDAGGPLRCANCGRPIIGIDGDWTHVCPPTPKGE